MEFDLHDRQFRTEENSANGEVSQATIFHYQQQGEVIFATYAGGQIRKGFLIGKIVDGQHLEFSYQHLNNDLEIRTGRCRSYPERLENGKLRLREHWEWTCQDYSSGQSTVVEI